MSDQEYTTKYSNSHALVIGINDYQNSSPLEFAKNDALDLAKILIDRFNFPERNVKLLVDDDATRESIHSSFLAYADDKTEPDDRLIFFFAGHGLTRIGTRGKVGYLVPYDGNPSKISTLIRWQELTSNSELIPAKHIFFIMDACYGGLTFSRTSLPFKELVYDDMFLRYSRQCLTAGKANEVVADSGGPKENHSIFTGHLLNALEGNGSRSDGIITASSVMSYVYENVGNDYESKQSPHFGHIDGDGDFIFNPHLISEDKLVDMREEKSTYSYIASKLKSTIDSKAEIKFKDEERIGVLKTTEGVEIAKSERNDLIITLKNLCEDLNRPKAGIVFGFKHKHLGPLQWEAKVTILESSGYIKFYIPFINSTRGIERENYDDCHVRTYFSNYNMFDDYRIISEQSKRKQEAYYYFNLDRNRAPGWTKNKQAVSNDFSTKELAENILSELYEFAEKHRSG